MMGDDDMELGTVILPDPDDDSGKDQSTRKTERIILDIDDSGDAETVIANFGTEKVDPGSEKTVIASNDQIEKILKEHTLTPDEGAYTPSPEAGKGLSDLYSITEQIANIGGWELDPSEETMRWSPGLWRIMGLAPDNRDLAFQDFLNAINPSDQEALREAVVDALATGGRFTFRHRITRPDMTNRYVVTEGVALGEGSHRPGVMAGFVHDITDKKDEEEKLELASKLFDHTVEGLMVTDTKSVIRFVNPAFTKITGFEAGEAIGKKTNILKSNHHDAEFYKEMWRALIRHGHWEGEIWNRRKNGDAYLAWLSITAVKNIKGATYQYIGVLFDRSGGDYGADDTQQSYRDALTGLPNRNLFTDRLAHAINHAVRHKEKVAVMKATVVGLYDVIAEHGHMAGDLLLQEAGNRLDRSLRNEDTVARIAGAVFFIIIERWEDSWGSSVVVNRINENFNRPYEIIGATISVSLDLGMAIFPDDSKTAEKLVKIAGGM